MTTADPPVTKFRDVMSTRTGHGSSPTSTQEWPKGTTLIVDDRDPSVNGEAGGFRLGPALFVDEIFGPVLSVVRVSGFD